MFNSLYKISKVLNRNRLNKRIRGLHKVAVSLAKFLEVLETFCVNYLQHRLTLDLDLLRNETTRTNHYYQCLFYQVHEVHKFKIVNWCQNHIFKEQYVLQETRR